jgi:hypothetical protein
MSFRAVRALSDLIEAIVAFLEGRLLQSPYHGGPIDDETRPLLSDLVALNRLGFVTVNGQPNRSDVSIHPDGQKWIAIEQRPFLEGYFDKRYLSAFRVYMETDPLENNCVYHAYLVTRQGYWWWQACCGLVTHLKYLEGNAPVRMCVTWDKAHPQRSQLANTPWRAYTYIDRTLNEYDFSGYLNIDDLLVEQFVKITLVGDAKEQLEKLMLAFMHAYAV